MSINSQKIIKNENNLVWIDMEMTGLDINTSFIIEVAVVITDSNLNILVESPSYVLHQSSSILQSMDNWNTKTHTKSGLLEKIQNSHLNEKIVEENILELIKPYTFKGKSPLCGNTVYQDRKFIAKFMPNLDNYLHYRIIDVSSIKELAKRWYPDIYNQFTKHNKHQALADILESINELKYYQTHIFKTK